MKINLTKTMSQLLTEFTAGELTAKQLIANSVQLGMQYQEEKIKEGINIVFEQLHEKI